MGKRYDAELVRYYCDSMTDAFTSYGQSVDRTQLACVNFADNDSFTGSQAEITKEMVGVVEVGFMDELLNICDTIKTAQNRVMEMFEADVDGALNARIDEETLDCMNLELKRIYGLFDSIGRQVEAIYRRLKKYEKYGVCFTKPDFESGRSASVALCGGDGNGAL